MHFTKKQNNIQTFVNLPIRPIILFCRQYFFEEVFGRLYFLVKITPPLCTPLLKCVLHDTAIAHLLHAGNLI